MHDEIQRLKALFFTQVKGDAAKHYTSSEIACFVTGLRVGIWNGFPEFCKPSTYQLELLTLKGFLAGNMIPNSTSRQLRQAMLDYVSSPNSFNLQRLSDTMLMNH